MRTQPQPLAYSAIVATPFGAIGIRSDAQLIHELVYLPKSFATQTPTDALAKRAAAQIQAYLNQPDTPFDLPLAQPGTAFQRRVWAAISAIPRGMVVTYGALAKQLGSAPRAVGQACGANWLPLIIPCHRVVASNGTLGGFAGCADAAGFLIGAKRWLLEHEGITTFSARVPKDLCVAA